MARPDSVCRLIVNADDLGLHEAIDEGILQAAEEGIVRSVSILATGRSFARAARLGGADDG